MSLCRFNPKRDKSEAGIIAALQKCGWGVWPLSGKGIPDLLVYVPQAIPPAFYLIEAKTGRGRSTEAQERFFAATAMGPRAICRTPEEAVEFVMGQLRGIA